VLLGCDRALFRGPYHESSVVVRFRKQVQVSQPVGQPDLQLRRAGTASATASAAAATAAAATGDADVPGRIGDPGDGRLPATTAAAAAATASAGAGTRLIRGSVKKDARARKSRPGIFPINAPAGRGLDSAGGSQSDGLPHAGAWQDEPHLLGCEVDRDPVEG